MLFGFLMCFSCTKDMELKARNRLSEIIKGKWTLSEAISPINYGDRSWHPISDGGETVFDENGNYSFYFSGQLIETAPYSVNDSDSVIIVEEPAFAHWNITVFARDSFIRQIETDEGFEKMKYIRLD
jgi:hypothetical protein